VPVTDDEAPGWDAIESAVARVHPGVEPLHWETGILPDEDGVYGLSAYRADGVWLLVTFGLTELFAKVSDDPDFSGFGFELTLGVPGEAAEPPGWARNLLIRLGSVVFSTGTVFEDGHRLDPGGPITGGADSRLTGLAFVTDPQLPAIDSPYGAASFLEVVGITAAELAEAQASSTAAVLQRLAQSSPLLVTDPHRPD
jgi:Suppressor of fused protein (SUFU)